MTDVHQRLLFIEKRLSVLIDQYEKATHKVATLEKNVEELKLHLEQKSQKIQELEGELRAARIAKSVASSSEDSELAKAKISTLVREIDRCIALLNE